MIKVLVLSLYSPIAASTRYRFVQYIPHLKDKGIDLCIYPLLSNKYLDNKFKGRGIPFINVLFSFVKRLFVLSSQKNFDCAIIHCELFPFLPAWAEKILIKIPYIYDFDDAFYLKYATNEFSFRSLFLGSKFNSIISSASFVTAGSDVLNNYAKKYNCNTLVLPTVVDVERYIPTKKKSNRIFNIGWIGSPSTSIYINELIEPLSEFGKEAKVVFTVIGGNAPYIPNIEVRDIPWSEFTEIDYINEFDVGVMPLSNDKWTQGKCAFKLIQYMACAIPVIASPVGANRIVVDDSCGLFAGDTNQWVSAFRYIKNNHSKGIRMGSNGRNRIIEGYSLTYGIPIIEKVIKTVCR